MPVFETPSRVWRRIQAADDLALPSLPSLPAIDNDDLEDDTDPSRPLQSTPSLVASTKKSTTVRFAETHESFEFSDILPITHQSILTDDDGDKPQVEYSIDISKQISPPSVDFNKHVAVRRARTPSLTRSASLPSTSSDATPSSDAHISLPNASRRSSSSLRQQSILEEPSRDVQDQRTKQSFSTSRTSSVLETQTTPRQVKQQQQEASTNDAALQATPHAKKRSFLLDVIQSNTKPRPRLSMHTPMQTRPSFNIPTSAAHLLKTPKPTVNDSFISTASSHDLTVHQPNVNASFDHLTGAKGVGRFNATKLNTYLHGLNRRLVEENEALTKQLKLQQPSTIMEGDESMKTLEIAALEDKVKDLEEALEKEKAEKESEKLKFKERVQEVEEGVNEIVEKLEQDLETMGQAKEQALIKVRRAQELKEDAEERARRAEVALAKVSKEAASLRRSAIGSPAGSGTGTVEHEEFKEAIERVVELEAELQVSTDRCQSLEDELRAIEEEVDELRLDKQVGERELTTMTKQVEELNAEADGLDARVKELEEELAESKQNAEQLLAELGQVQEEAEMVREEAEGAKADVEVLQERVDILETRCARFENESRQMEEALDAGETKAMEDQQEIESLRRELERVRALAASGSVGSSVRASTNTAVSAHASPNLVGPGPEEVESLEKELDEAYREIGRLQHALGDSPAREALTQAKETRIEILEKENADLEERIRTLRVLISKGPMAGNGSLAIMGTPLGRARSFAAASSPAAHHMPSLLGPKTPGGPLRDLSWLQTTENPDEMQYIRQISLLERELAHANESVDDKIDKLDEYGRGVIGLTDKLADAQSRIAFLDGEIKRLERREERRTRRLKKGVSCNGCGGTVHITNVAGLDDQSSMDASAAQAGDVTTNDSMRRVLDQLEKMKQDWAHEKMRLEGEREYLQGAADRLNREVDRAKKQQDTETEGVTSELDQARHAVAELESQLQTERARLKAITSERNRMTNEKVDIASNLKRTQEDMETVKEQLRKCKQENYALEADLRSNAIAETKSRHLQNKVAENQVMMDQLRHERDQLAESHSALQQRYTLASERVERLRTDLRTTQSTHDDRRHQLDLQIAEIDDLRREIAWRDEELALARRKGQAGSELAATVDVLEKEVDRVRADAEMFARELKTLRDSRDDLDLARREEVSRAERVQMQLKAQVRILDEQAEEQRARIRRLVEELETHVCIAGDDGAIVKLKAQHNSECKGLMVQIHYLKAKYTRENTFRMELAHQKQYLLLLLSKYHPSPNPIPIALAEETTRMAGSKRRRSLRSVAHIILFAIRARKAAEFWSEQNSSREQLMLALEDVRRRRAISGGRRSVPGAVDSTFQDAAFKALADFARSNNKPQQIKASKHLAEFYSICHDHQRDIYNVILDLCEDAKEDVRLAGYQALMDLSQLEPSLRRKNGDVFAQLLQNDQEAELRVVRTSLSQLIRMDPGTIYPVMIESMVSKGDNGEERCYLMAAMISFLSGGGIPPNSPTSTHQTEDLEIYRHSDALGGKGAILEVSWAQRNAFADRILRDGIIQALPLATIEELRVLAELLFCLSGECAPLAEGSTQFLKLALRRAHEIAQEDALRSPSDMQTTLRWLNLCEFAIGPIITPFSSLPVDRPLPRANPLPILQAFNVWILPSKLEVGNIPARVDFLRLFGVVLRTCRDILQSRSINATVSALKPSISQTLESTINLSQIVFDIWVNTFGANGDVGACNGITELLYIIIEQQRHSSWRMSKEQFGSVQGVRQYALKYANGPHSARFQELVRTLDSALTSMNEVHHGQPESPSGLFSSPSPRDSRKRTRKDVETKETTNNTSPVDDDVERATKRQRVGSQDLLTRINSMRVTASSPNSPPIIDQLSVKPAPIRAISSPAAIPLQQRSASTSSLSIRGAASSRMIPEANRKPEAIVKSETVGQKPTAGQKYLPILARLGGFNAQAQRRGGTDSVTFNPAPPSIDGSINQLLHGKPQDSNPILQRLSKNKASTPPTSTLLARLAGDVAPRDEGSKGTIFERLGMPQGNRIQGTNTSVFGQKKWSR